MPDFLTPMFVKNRGRARFGSRSFIGGVLQIATPISTASGDIVRRIG
jgi:hypothetical protein